MLIQDQVEPTFSISISPILAEHILHWTTQDKDRLFLFPKSYGCKPIPRQYDQPKKRERV